MRNVHTNFKHCLYDIRLRHSMLQLCSVVIFDNFVVLVSRFYWWFFILTYYYVINLIGTYILCGFVILGWVPGRWLISHEGASVCGGPRYII